MLQEMVLDSFRDVDKVVKELPNHAGSLASLNINFQNHAYKGDLPGADSQDATSILFQSALTFPAGDMGVTLLPPLAPILFDQPIFDASKGGFDEADTSLADATFDLVYAGIEMTDFKQHKGYLWGVGMATMLRTATNDDVAGKQWRAGLKLFLWSSTLTP